MPAYDGHTVRLLGLVPSTRWAQRKRMNALKQLFGHARREWQGNPRLRLGGWTFMLLALGYWVFVTQPQRHDAAFNDYSRTGKQLSDSRVVLANREALPTLLEAERATDAALTARLWQADTVGLAKATMQEAIERMLADLDLSNVSVATGTGMIVPDRPDLVQVRAQLTAVYTPGAELWFLHALASHKQRLVVERLTLRRGRRPSIAMTVSAYFRGIPPVTTSAEVQQLPAPGNGGPTAQSP